MLVMSPRLRTMINQSAANLPKSCRRIAKKLQPLSHIVREIAKTKTKAR